MKQSSISIPALTETFHLSQGERQLLLAVDVGEGIFFAGQNHVALRVVASPEEHEVITTNPEEVMRRQQEAAAASIPMDEIDIEQSTTPPELSAIYDMINDLEKQPAASDETEDETQATKPPTNPASAYSIDNYQPPSNQ